MNTKGKIDSYFPSTKPPAVRPVVTTTGGAKRWFNDYPNPRAYTIDPTKMTEKYPGQYHALKDRPEYSLVSGDIFKIPKPMYRFIPQPDPRWKELRGLPRITNSPTAEYLGMHDKLAATYLEIPPSMFRDSEIEPYSEKWEEYLEKVKYGYMPQRPMDPPGNVHCAYGDHEDNVVATLLDVIKPMKMQELGLIIITREHLAVFKPTNLLKLDPISLEWEDGEDEITELPFEYGVSGDFEAEIPEAIMETKDENAPYMFCGDTIKVAGECKTPTCYGMVFPGKTPRIPPLLEGAEFYFKNGGAKPYDHVKEYYVPQLFGEMLALGRDKNLFCSWTYSNGMTCWLVDMNIRYLSLMLTFLIHLHDEFVAHRKQVPTDYFMKTKVKKIMDLYIEFLIMTKTIAQRSPIYLKVPGTITRDVTDRYGIIATKSYVSFPNFPEDVMPEHQLIFVYGRRLIHDHERLQWTRSWRDLDKREKNLVVLCATDYTRFAKCVVDAIMGDDALYKVGVNKDIDAGELPAVRNKVLAIAERYILKVYKKLFMCYGSPPFPARDATEDTGLKLSTFFHHIVLEACVAYNELHIRVDKATAELCGDAGGVEGDIDEFDPLQHTDVLTTAWTGRMLAMGNSLVTTANVEYWQHVTLIGNKDLCPKDTEDETKPQQWQYMRLIMVLLLVDIVAAHQAASAQMN